MTNDMLGLIDKVFDEKISAGMNRNVQNGFFPLDFKETSATYQLYCDIPGVKKNEVKLELNDHILSISMEKKNDSNNESEKYWRKERFEGSMLRSIKLPEDSDEDKIAASCEDGVLKVTILKKKEEELKKTKHITIE
jgi:HSP20 family protein